MKCACGCGEEARTGRRYLRGHNVAQLHVRRLEEQLRRQADLGAVPDAVIAERLGVNAETVARVRARLGVAASRPRRGRAFWAAVEDLGVVSDAVVAARLGVPRSTVWRARKRFGLPACVS